LLKRANVGHRAISFPFGDRKSNRTMTLSAMTTIQHHFLSCRETPVIPRKKIAISYSAHIVSKKHFESNQGEGGQFYERRKKDMPICFIRNAGF
jgi:hypothetical protein